MNNERVQRKDYWKNCRDRVIKRIRSYAQHFACFQCRKMFNKQIADETIQEYSSSKKFFQDYCPPCPHCGQPMMNMGIGFKPPKRSDMKRWRVLEKQAQAGRRFWYVPSWL